MAEWSERDVDRVAAMGAAGIVSAAGVDLFRWAYGGDARAAVRLCSTLMEIVRSKYELPLSFAEAICQQAMREFVGWYCPTCGGRGAVTLLDGQRIECGDCHASGVRKYTDAERMVRCGFAADNRTTYTRVIEGPLEMALGYMRRADLMVNQLLNEQLERKTPSHSV
jgi:hypothetical protein